MKTHYAGLKYRIYGKLEEVLRIPEHHIKSSIYIYSSEAAARNGQPVGGSGFLIKAMYPDSEYAYAVTNVHILGECDIDPTIRVNRKGGGFLFITTNRELDWLKHPAGDDIAVCQVDLPNEADVAYIPSATELVGESSLGMKNAHIGPGDSTYMIGRFVTHEGSSSNTPISRFGNIAMNPSEEHAIINDKTGHRDEVFLVESRSVSGYSGSAVFVYIMSNEDRARDKPLSIVPVIGEYVKFLLGINIGHTRTFRPVVIDKSGTGDYKPATIDKYILEAEYNSGIMRIAPAWKLLDIFNSDELKEMRKKESQKKKRKSFALDSLSTQDKKSTLV